MELQNSWKIETDKQKKKSIITIIVNNNNNGKTTKNAKWTLQSVLHKNLARNNLPLYFSFLFMNIHVCLRKHSCTGLQRPALDSQGVYDI